MTICSDTVYFIDVFYTEYWSIKCFEHWICIAPNGVIWHWVSQRLCFTEHLVFVLPFLHCFYWIRRRWLYRILKDYSDSEAKIFEKCSEIFGWSLKVVGNYRTALDVFGLSRLVSCFYFKLLTASHIISYLFSFAIFLFLKYIFLYFNVIRI